MVSLLLLLLAAADPRAEIDALSGEVRRLLANPNAGPDQFEAAAVRHLDVDELVRRASGAHWRAMTATQRRELSSAFRHLLRASYGRHATGGRDVRTEIQSSKVASPKEAEVTVRVLLASQRAHTVHFRLHRRNAKSRWRIYDVVVLGSSLVEEYARTFQQTLADKGPDALIAKIRSRAMALEHGAGLAD